MYWIACEYSYPALVVVAYLHEYPCRRNIQPDFDKEKVHLQVSIVNTPEHVWEA